MLLIEILTGYRQCKTPLVLSESADARPIPASNAAVAKSDVTETSPVSSVSLTRCPRVHMQITIASYLIEHNQSHQTAYSRKTLHHFLAMSRHTRQPPQGRYTALCPRLESLDMGIG